MGKRTATNEGRSISTQGTEDWACAIVPDVCFSATAKVFKPYNNKVCSKLLQNGTAITTIAGKPIWTRKGQLGPPSDPQADQVKGQLSGKPAKGEARVIIGSATVFAEGSPVVRLDDLTFQNSKNTLGIVKAQPFDLALDGGPAQDDAAGKGGAKAKGKATKPPKRARSKFKDPGFPPSGTDPVAECWVTGMFAFCSHGRAPLARSAADFYLEVCGREGSPDEKVTLRAGRNGICGKEHPVWTGGPRQATGLEYVFEVPSAGNGPIAMSDLMNLAGLVPRDFDLACNGCKPGPHKLRVRAYPARWHKEDYKLDEIPALKRVKQGVDYLLGQLDAAAAVGVKFLEGSIQVDARLKEHTDHRVFTYYKLTFDIDPLISIEGEYIYGPKSAAIAKLANKLLDKLGKVGSFMRGVGDKVNQGVKDIGAWLLEQGKNAKSKTLQNVLGKAGGWAESFDLGELMGKLLDAGPYLKVEGGVSIKGEIERTNPDDFGAVTKPVGLKGTEKYKVGLRCNVLNGKLFSFDFNGSGSRVSTGSLFIDQQGVGLQDGKIQIDSIAVQSRIKLMNGSWGDSAAYPGMEGIQNPDTWDFLEQFPSLKEHLCQTFPGKLHLYKFKTT